MFQSHKITKTFCFFYFLFTNNKQLYVFNGNINTILKVALDVNLLRDQFRRFSASTSISFHCSLLNWRRFKGNKLLVIFFIFFCTGAHENAALEIKLYYDYWPEHSRLSSLAR